MRVRITCSDGLARHARVVNADTGEAATLELRIHPALCDVTCEWRPDAISDRMVKAAAWAIGQASPVSLKHDEMDRMARNALEHAIDVGRPIEPPERVSRESRGGLA